ncbi:MAG: hypothetical protein ACRERD_17610 [Candidatus Binatia bacterium]
MKKSSRIGVREKTKIGQETIAESARARWIYPPRGSLEDFIAGKHHAIRQKRQETLGEEVDDMRIIRALREGDVEPFFQGLRYDPTILISSPIFRMTIGTWWLQKHLASDEGQRARLLLTKIGKVLADPAGRPELPYEERAAKKKESNAISKRCFDDRVRAAVNRLEPEILAEHAQKKPSVALPKALASRAAVVRAAARLVQEKINKGKL